MIEFLEFEVLLTNDLGSDTGLLTLTKWSSSSETKCFIEFPSHDLEKHYPAYDTMDKVIRHSFFFVCGCLVLHYNRHSIIGRILVVLYLSKEPPLPTKRKKKKKEKKNGCAISSALSHVFTNMDHYICDSLLSNFFKNFSSFRVLIWLSIKIRSV